MAAASRAGGCHIGPSLMDLTDFEEATSHSSNILQRSEGTKQFPPTKEKKAERVSKR